MRHSVKQTDTKTPQQQFFFKKLKKNTKFHRITSTRYKLFAFKHTNRHKYLQKWHSETLFTLTNVKILFFKQKYLPSSLIFYKK